MVAEKPCPGGGARTIQRTEICRKLLDPTSLLGPRLPRSSVGLSGHTTLPTHTTLLPTFLLNHPPPTTTISEEYKRVEERITNVIAAIQTRNGAKRAQIAREFNVPLSRLRSRINGSPSKSAVRGLHNRALKPDQEAALRIYLIRLDRLGIPASLNMVERTANTILRQDHQNLLSAPTVGYHWAKRWLDRQPDLFKAKRKPLQVERKNAQDPVVLMAHFTRYKEVVEKYGLLPSEIWNFNETGFRIGMARTDYVVTIDPRRAIRSKDPGNRKSLTSVEAINGVGRSIPPILILTGINLLAPFFLNDLDDEILVTTADTGYSNDWIALQWIKHFDKHSLKSRVGA